MKKLIYRNRPYTRPYHGPCTDILCDNLLIQIWDEVCDIPLSDYIDYAYEVLADKMQHINAKWIPIMIEHDWLRLYGTKSGMQLIFQQFAKRLKRPIDIDGLIHDFFEVHYEENLVDFRFFYEKLQTEVAKMPK